MRELGGDSTRWGELEHLVAMLVDVQAQSNWMYASVHSKQRPEMPPPLRRPGTADPKRIGGKRSYTSAEVDEIRARMTPKAG